jgi:hypothetical protein
MKLTLGVCLLALAAASIAVAQDQNKPVLRPGIRVQMSTVSHAVEVPEADAGDATVVAITSTGKVFLGTVPVDMTALSNVKPATVYVKVDARAPFQSVLTALDALRGHSVVLLTAPTSGAQKKGEMMQPYGVKVSLGE